MALYEVTGPDGTVYELEGPDGATEQQVIQAARRLKREEEISRLRAEANALASAPPAPTPPQTTFFGGIGEFAKGIPAGAIGLAETAAIGASALAPDEYEQSIRDVIGSTAKTLRSPFEAAPGYEDTVARKFGEATGSIVPFLATAPFGLPGLAVAGGLGVGAGAGEARVRAEEGGATAEERETPTQLGALVGTTEMIPVAKFASSLRKVLPPSVATKLTPAGKTVQETVDEFSTIMGRGKRILSTAGYEGVQEFAANTAQNLIERGIYNPEQGVFTDSGEALGYGAGVGGLTQAITDMIIGRRVKGSAAAKPATPEEEGGPSAEDLINAATTDIAEPTFEPPPEATPEDEMIRESAPGIEIAYPAAGQDVAALEAEAEAIRTGQPIAETVAPVAPQMTTQEEKAAEIGAAFDTLKGGAATADFYEKAFQSLQQGRSTVSGVREPLLTQAKPLFDAGQIKSPADLKAFYEQELKAPKTPAVPEAPTISPELELGEVSPPVSDTGEAPGSLVPPKRVPGEGLKKPPVQRFGYDPVTLEETGMYSPVPVDQGGQLFANKKDAQKAKLSAPMPMKLSSVDGGYTLVPQKPEEIEANKKKGQRLAQGLGITNRPLTAEEFLAANGGLKRELAPDLRVDGNLPLGNRYLIAGKGKGLEEGRAAELLVEEGYMSPDENMFDVLNESIAGKPRYSMAGYNQLTEQRSLEAEPTEAAEPVSVRQQAEVLGIDPLAIEEEVARREDLTAEQFDQAVESRLQQEIDQRRGQVSDEIDFFDRDPAKMAAPDWVPEKIWRLHEAARRAEDEASGQIPLRPNKEGKVPSVGSLKRNQTMAFRRLLKAVEDHVGGEWASQNELMTRMNEESSKRESDRPEIDFFDIQLPQTEEFKTWFGKSKVLDREGNPQPVYHGTNQDINEFTTQPGSMRRRFYAGELGSWFGDDPQIANNFARGISSPREGGVVYPVYLKITNPKVYDSYESFQEATKGRRSASALRRDLIAQGFDGIQIKDSTTDFGGRRDDWVAFYPNQIKSVFNARPTDSSNILEDRNPGYAETGQVRDANDVDALNEDIRDQKIREYQSLRQRLAGIQRRRVEGESGITDAVMERALYRRAADLRDAIEASKPRRDSAEDFIARAAKALADGDIDRDVYDVIDAMFKKNPKFLEGLRLSVVSAQGDSAGQFIPFARIVRLFKGSSGVMNPGTIRHEFAHSMEQMMPADVKTKIVDKWRDALAKEIKKNQTPQAQKYYEAVLNFIEKPSRDNYFAAINALPSYEYYQYLNPSEYWAVNAEPLMKSYLGSGWQRFKMSMRGMLESIKKVFGLKNNSEIYQAFKDIIDGDRKGSQMLVDYIRVSSPLFNIDHYNYRGVPTTQLNLPTWEMPPDVMTSKLFGSLNKTLGRYKFIDKMADLRDAQKAIESKSKEIDDAFDASAKEQTYHGKVANEQKKYLKQEVEPILKKMQQLKIAPEEWSAYALAKHAEERNKRVAEINDRFPDGGSGISTAKAKAYLDRLPQQRRSELESLNKMIRDFIQRTQDLEVDYQLTERSIIENGRKLYPNYVPLFRTELDYDQGGSGLGRGFDVRGPMSKRAVGSKRDIKDIFSSIIEQREKVLIKGEKDKIGRSLYALSIANPNPDFWLPINPDAIKDPAGMIDELQKMGLTPEEAENLMGEPKVPQVYRVKDPQTGQYREEVRYVNSPRAKISDNVIGTRVNGKQRYIIFNPNNERAARLAKSLKNLDAEQLGFLTQKVGNVTRWIASMSTQYNPIFGLWNFVRDLQGAALNLTTTELKGKQAEVLSGAFKFLPGMYREYRAFRRGDKSTGETSQLLREFLEAGGQTGYRDQFTRIEEKGTIVQRELEKLNPGNVRKVVNAVGGWLSDYNDVLENAVRLSAFDQARKMGLSDQKAAVIAKNLTVNFNRKGANTPGLSALYAFFNAAVQGTARMTETLTGPAGRRIVAGGMLLGAVQAAILEAFDFGEDEPSEFIKQKNLIIPLGDGKYLTWPMPLGFNFLPNIGRILTEMTFDGRTKARDRIVDLMGVMVDAFNPLGGAGFAQTISPTIIDPFVAVTENRDAFGRPISREDQATNPSPGYLRSRDNASEFSKLLSEALNYMSGGTEFTKGIVSPTADDIDYVVGQYLGGVGREAQKFTQLAKSQVTGEEIETFRIPLFGKMYGETTSPAAVSSNFYRTIIRMSEHEAEIKGRIERRESPAQYIAENPEARMYAAANRLENQISKINKTIREIRKQDPKDPRIKLLEERRTETMQMFLDRLDELYPNER
jgi:hypothetical protein